MKYAGFKYDYSLNIGDEIQSLAAEQFLPIINKRFDRDSLRFVNEAEKYLIIMNGWYSHYPDKCFPPSDSILPVFISFHLTDANKTREYFSKKENIAYLKQFEPIGCRDKDTMKFLNSNGINAFFSRCLTLTFPTRITKPENGKVFIVDADHIPIPEHLFKESISITHSVYDMWGDEIKMAMAKKLIDIYKREARLVITTRIHCVLPCLAMGIPVIFFGGKDSRYSVIDDLGIKVNKVPGGLQRKIYKKSRNMYIGILMRKLLTKFYYNNLDWSPKPINIDSVKQELIDKTKEMIKKSHQTEASS